MSLRLHQWIRELYLAAVETGAGGFALEGLSRVAALVPHALAHWQTMDAQGGLLSQHEHGVPNAATGSADKSLAGLGEGPHTAIYSIVGNSAAQRHRLVFRRSRNASEFDHDERRRLEQAAEHLVGADEVHRRVQALAATPSSRENGIGRASVDAAGLVLSADAEFTQLLRSALPDWNGRALPFALPEDFDPAQPGMVFRGLWVMLERDGGGWQLRMRRDRRALKLSGRELGIAERVAEGFTFKEIAGDLGVAPSTVSTHLYNLYAKLGIRRRAELVAWLRQYRGES